MNKKLRIIFQNANLIDTLYGSGRFEEANQVKHETSNIIHDLIRTNKVKYNEHWLKVHHVCQAIDIDTTELEVELSFSQG